MGRCRGMRMRSFRLASVNGECSGGAGALLIAEEELSPGPGLCSSAPGTELPDIVLRSGDHPSCHWAKAWRPVSASATSHPRRRSTLLNRLRTIGSSSASRIRTRPLASAQSLGGTFLSTSQRLVFYYVTSGPLTLDNLLLILFK